MPADPRIARLKMFRPIDERTPVMHLLFTPIMANPDYVHATKYTGTPYCPGHSRFASGWWIIPLFISGLMSWFFILRMVFSA